MSIPVETRRESYEAILPMLTARQNTVLQILKECGDMTAQEVADTLCFLRITPTNERNFAAPRLTELCDKGLVRAVGKKTCPKTGRTVTVWSVTGKAKRREPEPASNIPSLQIELSMMIWLNSLERGGGKAKQHINRKKRRGITSPPLFVYENSI